MLKILLSPVLLLVVAWLGMWAANYGVLVLSTDSSIPKTRDCRYLVGVSVLKRIEPLADRCPLIRSIGT